MDRLEKILHYLVAELVDNKEEIKIEKKIEDKEGTRVIFKIRVADGELGKLIGKKGSMAHSLRTLLQCAAIKTKVKSVKIDFLDN